MSLKPSSRSDKYRELLKTNSNDLLIHSKQLFINLFKVIFEILYVTVLLFLLLGEYLAKLIDQNKKKNKKVNKSKVYSSNKDLNW